MSNTTSTYKSKDGKYGPEIDKVKFQDKTSKSADRGKETQTEAGSES